MLTTGAVFGTLLVVAIRDGRRSASVARPSLYLSISRSDRQLNVADIIAILREHCESADLQRSDEGAAGIELAFVVQFANEEQYLASREALLQLDPDLAISFVDLSGI